MSLFLTRYKNKNNQSFVVSPQVSSTSLVQAMNITTTPEETMANATLTSWDISISIIPKVTGMLSLMGSALIIHDGIRILRRTLNGLVPSTYHRILVSMSAFDLSSSMCYFLSTWPIPRGTPGAFQAVGTQGTCTAQGFFSEVGNITVVLYNAMLCVYQVLSIRKGWKEYYLSNIQWMFHVIPILVGLTMGIMGLVFSIFGPAGHLCWYVTDPPGGLFRKIHYGIIWCDRSGGGRGQHGRRGDKMWSPKYVI